MEPSGPSQNGRSDVPLPLFEVDGSDADEATYSVMIGPGEEILTGDGRKLRVVDVVPVKEEDDEAAVL